MAQIRWSSQAQRDLANIAEFIARDSKKYARITLQKIVDRTKVLVDDPHSGRVVPEVGVETIRELIYSHYRIVYHIKSDGIFIITVHHTAMLFNPG